MISKKLALCIKKIRDYKYRYLGRLNAFIYKNSLAECGDNLIMYGNPVIFAPEKVHIGKNVIINDRCQIAPRGDIFIGDYVTMSRGSQIVAGEYDTSNWVSERFCGIEHVAKSVYIADGTWLCVNSIVLPGVSIRGKGVIVAAGAVVAHDIEDDFVIVGGVPAKIVKYMNQNQ